MKFNSMILIINLNNYKINDVFDELRFIPDLMVSTGMYFINITLVSILIINFKFIYY